MTALDQEVARPLESPPAAVSRLPRVLYVAAMDPTQKFGSMEEQMAFLARAFAEDGSVFLPLFDCRIARGQPTPLEAAGVMIECLDMSRFRWLVLSRLLALIRRHRIGIVHWNFSAALFDSYMWWLTLLRPQVKHYFTDHNSRSFPLPAAAGGWKKRLKRLLLARYAKVLCVSRFVQDSLQEQGVWSNLECCLHFVNTDRFQPDPQVRAKVRRERHAEDRFVLLTVAHLIKEKGIDVALRALGLLPEEVVLWVIGGGAEGDALRGLAREMGLGERVVFLGQQAHVEPFMQAADCFVCPSVWAEAAGLVNLEAQASGLPVIASRVGGIPEYVADGRSGFLFSPGDAAELADCVSRLVADPGLRRRMGAAARELALQQFSPAARLPEMIALYRS
jgi:glycosyltransferase involved in cell wall biosynthesis